MNAIDEKRRLTREWLKIASRDLMASSRLLEPPELLASAAFHTQQAMEKALKGYLTWNDQPFRKTHNLIELVAECAALDSSFEELELAAARLNSFAAETRYPDMGSVLESDEVRDAFQLASSAVGFVHSRLPEDVLP